MLLGFWGTPSSAFKAAMMSLAFGAFTALAFMGAGFPPHVMVFIAAISSVAWAVIFTAVFGGWLAAAITRRQRALGPARIVVDEQGLERSTRSARVSQDWEGILRVVETSRAFLMFDASGPVFAIEKSALPTQHQVRALREFLQARKPGRYRAD